MKKIVLNVADFRATEILSRNELKKVLGGVTGSGSGSDSTDDSKCSNFCSSSTDCATSPKKSKCPNCNVVANWGGKKVCEVGVA